MNGHPFINPKTMDMKIEKTYYIAPEVAVNLLCLESHVCLSGKGTISATTEEADNEEWTGIY